jgi:hypothetical protein
MANGWTADTTARIDGKWMDCRYNSAHRWQMDGLQIQQRALMANGWTADTTARIDGKWMDCRYNSAHPWQMDGLQIQQRASMATLRLFIDPFCKHFSKEVIVWEMNRFHRRLENN